MQCIVIVHFKSSELLRYFQMQYAIVEFNGEDLVELVPVSWISGDMCKWPPHASDVSKMIKKACDPEEDWKEYKVELKGLFGE